MIEGAYLGFPGVRATKGSLSIIPLEEIMRWFCFLVCWTNFAFGQLHDPVTDAFDYQEARQFDFWVGAWSVNLRMIQDDASWRDGFQAKAHIFRILDGKGILELWDSPHIKGFSLRYYDPKEKKWQLWLSWPQPNQASLSSLKGAFRHGRGEFFSKTTNTKGEEVLSRYTFCDISGERFRWDDAYSKDGGKTWTNNWIMEFSRTADLAPWSQDDQQAHTFQGPGRCDGAKFKNLEPLAGSWAGSMEILVDGQWTKTQGSLKCYLMNRGCGLIQFLQYRIGEKTFKSFALLLFNSNNGAYEQLVLDNGHESGINRFKGKMPGPKQWVLKDEETGHRTRWFLKDNQTLMIKGSVKSEADSWSGIFKGNLKKEK